MSQLTDTGASAPSQGSGQTGSGQDSEAAQAVREKTQQTTERVRGQVSSQVDQRSTQAGERLSSMAGDAHTVGEELRKQGKDQPARLADQAADRVQRVGGYLQESDGDRILSDLEDFGRRQPAALIAGGLAIGFLASRFLKASSAERHSRLGTSSGRLGTGSEHLGTGPGEHVGTGAAQHSGTGTRPSGFAPHR